MLSTRQKKSSNSKHVVSASELSYLKAEVWALQNKLKDEKASTKSLSESFRKLANEKYELMEELTRKNLMIEELHKKLDEEIEINEILANEVDQLNKDMEVAQQFLEKAIAQNIKLKRTSIEANETIHQMGLMYLKLKERNP
ncbi:hypothetical protein PVAND_008665 [Polypedilum vanderplanki]|uniref:Uncharacterized protein n=1 Tax=Polypedilum vanderplanki TaxID=319348 RepID=A0A9J6CAB4_POLVA|nr:hypothetical protein PVAND_008665 [Polypedilum vanderplanki]